MTPEAAAPVAPVNFDAFWFILSNTLFKRDQHLSTTKVGVYITRYHLDTTITPVLVGNALEHDVN